LAPHYRPERKGDVKHSLASIGKAKKLIGYEPRITVMDGLQMAVEWYKQSAL